MSARDHRASPRPPGRQLVSRSPQHTRQLASAATQIRQLVDLYATLSRRDGLAGKNINGQYNSQRATLIQKGFNNVPIWITEVGFPAEAGGDVLPASASRKHQCLRITAAYSRFARRGASSKPTAFVVHHLVDPTNNSEKNRFGVTRLSDESDANSALVKKESYRGLQKLTDGDQTHKPVNCKP